MDAASMASRIYLYIDKEDNPRLVLVSKSLGETLEAVSLLIAFPLSSTVNYIVQLNSFRRKYVKASGDIAEK